VDWTLGHEIAQTKMTTSKHIKQAFTKSFVFFAEDALKEDSGPFALQVGKWMICIKIPVF